MKIAIVDNSSMQTLFFGKNLYLIRNYPPKQNLSQYERNCCIKSQLDCAKLNLAGFEAQLSLF